MSVRIRQILVENFVFPPNTFFYFKYIVSISTVNQTSGKLSVLTMPALASAALGLRVLLLDGTSCLEAVGEGVMKLGL